MISLSFIAGGPQISSCTLSSLHQPQRRDLRHPDLSQKSLLEGACLWSQFARSSQRRAAHSPYEHGARAVLFRGNEGDDDLLVAWIGLNGEMTADERGELFGRARFWGDVPNPRGLVSAAGNDATTIWAIRRAMDAIAMASELTRPTVQFLPPTRAVLSLRAVTIIGPSG